MKIPRRKIKRPMTTKRMRARIDNPIIDAVWETYHTKKMSTMDMAKIVMKATDEIIKQIETHYESKKFKDQ